MVKETTKKMNSKTKTAIVVLIILMVLSTAALTVRIVYMSSLANKAATTVVPDNLIGNALDSYTPSYSGNLSSTPSVTAQSAQKATSLSLYKSKEIDSEPFAVQNMLPGDSITRYFAVKVSHKETVGLNFSTEIKNQTKNLGDSLQIKVTYLESGKVLYNGSLSKLHKNEFCETLTAKKDNETAAFYKIEAWLPKSTGNEYQAAELCCDFNWFIKDTDSLSNPQTGDNTSINLWLLTAIVSLTVLIILLFFRLKGKEDKYEQQ